MLLELGVPQGQITYRDPGGSDSFSAMLERAAEDHLTVYVKVSLSKEGERSEGIISYKNGVPALALYVFQPTGMRERWFLGEKALGFLWEDSASPSAQIATHDGIKLDDLEASLPQAKISKATPPPSTGRKDTPRRNHQSKFVGKWTEQEIKDEMDRKRVDEQEQGVYDLILQQHRLKAQAVLQCPKCGGTLDIFGRCRACAEEPSIETKSASEKGTFESLVIGPSNKFAVAASQSVAAKPGLSFNPLVIEGGPGLGKTHLLQAIRHRTEKLHPEMKVILAPSVTFDADLRKSAMESDVFLIDDIQYFAGKDKAQEDLLRVMGHLIDRGKQVVLTCDRAPKDIPSFSSRLLSRLDGGLLVDIQPPEESMRLEVLRRRTAESGLSIPEEVLLFIAQNCTENLRQVEGGLNRVAAFSTLMHMEVTIEMAREVLGVKQSLQKRPLNLEKGQSYLLEDERPERCYDILAERLAQGHRALIISRTNPSTIRQRVGSESPEILWLTEHESKVEKTVPPSLEKIILMIEDFMHQDGDSILLIDDLQYLISSATFDGVIRFIRTLVDQISERPSIFLLSINPESMRSQERSILQREMEPLRVD